MRSMRAKPTCTSQTPRDALTTVAAVDELRFVDEGGPGSGYSQPCIVLAEGHTLTDFAAYFATLASEVH